SIDGRHRVLSEMLELLSQVPNTTGAGPASHWQMRENVILGRLAQDLKISETTIRERLQELRTNEQLKSGTPAAARSAGDDADSQRAASRAFPKNPSHEEKAEWE